MSDRKRKRAAETSPGAKMGGAETVAARARRFISALRNVSDPLSEIALVKKQVKGLLDITKNEENLDAAAEEGAVEVVVPLLKAINGGDAEAINQPTASGAEELERDICFILGLLAIKVEHQQAICDAGALPTLVAMIKRYAARDDVMLSGVSAHTCRRAADAVTNLAHENNTIKNKVRQEAGIPPLVALLRSVDAKVQRGVAGTLRTLAFKNDENKGIIVELGSLPLLINMLRAEDATIHYEAVGVVGNLVHSSPAIKRRVLEEGALQPVINLLSSPCPDSQREAALLLGQFATTDGETFKLKIVQRGAVPPLIEMLSSADAQLKEMAAFALGRLAQNSDNQAGVVASGGLPPLLDLLESQQGNLQHNAAFALYGLSDNEDNLVEFVRDGAVQRILDCELIVQASRDCVNKLVKRLQDRMHTRILNQILYIMQSSSAAAKQRIAVAVSLLTTPETPGARALALVYLEKRALDILLGVLTDPHASEEAQRQAARALMRAADNCGASAPINVDPEPPEPKVYLGAQYVNSQTLSDVTFVVEGRPFYAHRIALLAASDTFSAMFGGNYREKSADSIEIPNIRWEAFEAMMHCLYTGNVKVAPELAQELLQVSDQYMIETLKRLCEQAIAEQLAPDNVSAVYDLAEQFNAPELGKRAALYCLEHWRDMLDAPKATPASYAIVLQKMAPRLRKALEDEITAKAGEAMPQSTE